VHGKDESGRRGELGVLSEKGTWRELEVVVEWNWAENELERMECV
jgi:hypothetical protein